jgi:hypothetical protein
LAGGFEIPELPRLSRTQVASTKKGNAKISRGRFMLAPLGRQLSGRQLRAALLDAAC